MKRLNEVVVKERYAPEGIEHVLTAIKSAFATSSRMRGLGMETNEQAICSAVRDLAFFLYKDKAAETLQGWGITDSICVGEIMALFVKAGFFQYSNAREASLEDFRGIYTVGDESWNKALCEPDPRRGTCAKCKYDLRATPSRVCPECGNHN